MRHDGGPTTMGWGPALLGCGLFVLSAGLVVAAARGELWFDEVWSLGLAERARNLGELLSRGRFDNNHVLNTAYLWLLGPDLRALWAYRLLSVGSAVATIAVAAWLAGRTGVVDGLAALVLVGTSYPLVLYGSEARGYAPAILCALVAWAAVQACWRRMAPGRVLLAWLALALGILAHLTFVLVAVALGVATVVREARTGRGWGRAVGRLVALFLPPAAFYAWFYVVFVRHVQVIGGPVHAYRDVVGTAAVMALGLPDGGGMRLLATAVCLAIVVAGAVLALRRRRPAEAVFFVTVLVGAPALLLAVTRPTHLYFRYFVVTFPFLYLLLARLAGAFWRRAPRVLAVGALAALLVAWLVGQGQRVGPLLVLGRGQTGALLAYVSAHSPPGELRIGSESESALLLSLYARFLPDDQTLRIVRAPAWPTERPEWMVTRRQRRGSAMPDELEFGMSGRYRRVSSYPYAGVSGWSAFLWRRIDDERSE
jgi:hypothetical protein